MLNRLKLTTYARRRRAADAGALATLALVIAFATLTLGADTTPPGGARAGSPGTRAAGDPADVASVGIVRRERAAGGGRGPVRLRRTVGATADGSAPPVPSTKDGGARKPAGTSSPAPGSAPVPVNNRPATGDKALRGGDYQAFATATSMYVSPTATPEDELTFEPITVAQSTSSAAIGATSGPLITRDALGQKLLSRVPGGIGAFGRGAALTGLHEFSNGSDNTTVEATSPGDHPNGDVAYLNPHYPPADTRVIGASAAADTGNRGRCVVDRPLDEGHADLVTGRVLQLATGDGPDAAIDFHTLGLRGGADSNTAIRLLNRGDGHGTVLTQAVVTMPEVTLLEGFPAETVIRVVTPFELDLQASGTPGGAAASFGPVGDARDAKVQIVSGGKTTNLDVPFDPGAEGVEIPIGHAGRLAIGPPKLQVTPDGRSAQAVVDVLSLSLPEVNRLPSVTEQVAPGLTPLATELQDLYDKLQSFSLAGGFRELRLGHLEARISVPDGGVRC